MPREIGAENFVLSNKPESMAAAAKSLDLILNTVSADHDLTALIGDSRDDDDGNGGGNDFRSCIGDLAKLN